MNRKAQYLYQLQNLKNNETKYKQKDKISQNLNNSFSKEFTNIEEELYEDDENNLLAQSYSYSQINKYREQILKEPLNIILDDFLISKDKKNKKRKIKFITSKDISKLNTKLLNEDKNKNKESSIEEYLKIRNNLHNENKFNNILKNLLNESSLNHLYNIINKTQYKLNVIFQNNNISPIFTIDHLFNEIQYTNQLYHINNDINITTQYNKLKPIIYRYRQIKGDGNCYYRAVMFRYLEQIILEKNIILLKKIILDMNQFFNSKEIKSRLYIKMDTTLKPELHLKIMILILNLLEKGKIKEAHELFVKSILSCQIFDYGLILYFRYIIYLYIKDNENKLFSINFPIKVGNLLPSNYENEKGEFEYNKFYQEYLLKMYMEAEKIIIYLTPFILGINLDIILFEDNEDNIVNRFSYEQNNSENQKDNIVITLLNRNAHYEIIYTSEEYNKYSNIYKNYEIPEINNNNNPENNILENSCDSEYFLLQSNRDIKKDINTNKKNDIKEYEINIYNNISSNITTSNDSLIKNKNQQNETKIKKLVNIDNNESYPNNSNNQEIKKKPEMEIKTFTETPIGHPEDKLDINYLNKIDNMFSENSINLNCLICQKKITESFKDKYNICNKCLEKEIINKLKKDYSIYLNNKGNSNNKFIIKEIKINKYTLNIKDIYDILKVLLNINNEKDLINYLKKLVCIKCFKIFDDKNVNAFNFPCGCSICNKEELENYFTVQNIISSEYKCICGYNYEPKDFYNLCEECDKIDCSILILFIINIFNKSILCKGCSRCGNTKKNKFKINYKPDTNGFCFENYIHTKNFSLDHFMCEDCIKKNEEPKYICFYCKKNHLYIPEVKKK